jgi:hypothetical protein
VLRRDISASRHGRGCEYGCRDQRGRHEGNFAHFFSIWWQKPSNRSAPCCEERQPLEIFHHALSTKRELLPLSFSCINRVQIPVGMQDEAITLREGERDIQTRTIGLLHPMRESAWMPLADPRKFDIPEAAPGWDGDRSIEPAQF